MFEAIASFIVFDLIKINPLSYEGEALHFFVADVMKIFVLLIFVISLIAYIRSYFPATHSRRLLAGSNRHIGHLLAAGLGIVTPFCSCSAVPMFIGFIEAGIPLGITMTFLIASPTINELAIALIFGLFGLKITALYIGSGLIIAIVAGYIISGLKMEKYVEDYVWEIKFGDIEDVIPSQQERIRQSIAHTRQILSKIWLYVFIGVGLGALIHGYVPAEWISAHLGSARWWSVPLAVAIGVPLYGNCGTALPIAEALISKGVPLGTALALMMSITAISMPEIVLLRRVLKPRLLATFVAIVAVAIMIVGFLFNIIL